MLIKLYGPLRVLVTSRHAHISNGMSATRAPERPKIRCLIRTTAAPWLDIHIKPAGYPSAERSRRWPTRLQNVIMVGFHQLTKQDEVAWWGCKHSATCRRTTFVTETDSRMNADGSDSTVVRGTPVSYFRAQSCRRLCCLQMAFSVVANTQR